MIWFTSDTHFGHEACIRHCARPWSSAEEMDEALIAAWNEHIAPKDEVWHLGDFCWRGDPQRYLSRLNGRIHLVLGNHDEEKRIAPLVEWCGHVRYLRADGRRFWLSHYAHRVWPGSDHGSFHLFGHSHGDIGGHGRSMDVGVDAIARWWVGKCYEPVSIDQVVARLEQEPVTLRHPEVSA